MHRNSLELPENSYCPATKSINGELSLFEKAAPAHFL
jgi:hypothetical protein